MQKAKKPVFLYYGDEEYLIEEKIRERKSRLQNASFSLEYLEGKDLTAENFIAALQTSPLVGEEKLVIVRDLKFKTEEHDFVLQAIKDLPTGVELIFQSSAVDRRSRFYKLVSETGEACEFKSFAPWEQYELANWIRDKAAAGGKKITEGAACRLAEITGSQLRPLATELEKLSAYVGEKKEITEQDVVLLASPGETSAFELLDALRDKDLKRALIVFQELLRNKEEPFQLLSLISTQYRLMLQIKALPTREREPNKIARLVGGSPFFVKKCLERIDRFDLAELKQAMEKLLETNLKMKTGEAQAIVFELLLTSLCGA